VNLTKKTTETMDPQSSHHFPFSTQVTATYYDENMYYYYFRINTKNMIFEAEYGELWGHIGEYCPYLIIVGECTDVRRTEKNMYSVTCVPKQQKVVTNFSHISHMLNDWQINPFTAPHTASVKFEDEVDYIFDHLDDV
jgi:hypothetical protein